MSGDLPRNQRNSIFIEMDAKRLGEADRHRSRPGAGDVGEDLFIFEWAVAVTQRLSAAFPSNESHAHVEFPLHLKTFYYGSTHLVRHEGCLDGGGQANVGQHLQTNAKLSSSAIQLQHSSSCGSLKLKTSCKRFLHHKPNLIEAILRSRQHFEFKCVRNSQPTCNLAALKCMLTSITS